jgi:geranylgeranyl pyrophosphate synthase
LLDYTATEAEMGKPVLDDLRNGLLTAPILLALESERLTDIERQTLQTDVQSLFDNPTKETIGRIQDLLAKSEAVEETRQLAHRYIAEAKESLAFVSNGAEKQALLTLVDYITERRH